MPALRAAASGRDGESPAPVEGNVGGSSVIHSREKVNLCCEIIHDQFGSLTARVAAIILQRGRLTFREICRFLANPTMHAPTGYIPDSDDGAKDANADAADDYLGAAPGASTSTASSSSSSGPLKSQRIIQQALLTLIQHNLCWHARTTANGMLVESYEAGYTTDVADGIEHFQMNVDAVLPRLRFGVYLQIAEERFGAVGRAALWEILQNGKMRASDVIERVASTSKGSRTKTRDVVSAMLMEAYLQPYLSMQNASPRDRRLHKEAELFLATRKHKNDKDRRNIAEQARSIVADEDNQPWFQNDVRVGFIPAPAKRKVNGNGASAPRKAPPKRGRPSKKMKLEEEAHAKSNGRHLALSDDEDEDAEDYTLITQGLTVDPEVILRLNHSRFDMHLRDEMILGAVGSRFNATVARVMEAMLDTANHTQREKLSVPSVYETVSAPFHVHQLREKLSRQESLKAAFDRAALKQELGSEVTHSGLINEIVNILMGAEDMSSSGQAKRFVAPASSESNGSAIISSSSRANLVQLQYRNIARVLRSQILQNIVRAQFDAHGIRVLSVLSEMGKLDEKQISKLCLMAIGETRDVCARLFASGLLSLQEVPKSNDRTPARTFFLWYIDVAKCNAWLANRLYKTLSRLAQRRRQELGREATLAAKLQRTDTTQADSYMATIEHNRLNRVRETIRTLTLAELRTWRDLFVVTTLPD